MEISSWMDITRRPVLPYSSSYAHTIPSQSGYGDAICIDNTTDLIGNGALIKTTSRIVHAHTVVAERYYVQLTDGMYRLIAVRYRRPYQFDDFVCVVSGINRFTNIQTRCATIYSAMLTYLASLPPYLFMAIGSASALSEYGNPAREYALCPANPSHVWYDVDNVLHVLRSVPAEHDIPGLAQAAESVSNEISSYVHPEDTITYEHRWRDVSGSEMIQLCGVKQFDVLVPKHEAMKPTHINPHWTGPLVDMLIRIPLTDFEVTVLLPAGQSQPLPTPMREQYQDRYAYHFVQCGTMLNKEHYTKSLTSIFQTCIQAILSHYGRTIGMPRDLTITITKSYRDIARLCVEVDDVPYPILDIHLDLFAMAIFGHGVALQNHLPSAPVADRDVSGWL